MAWQDKARKSDSKKVISLKMNGSIVSLVLGVIIFISCNSKSNDMANGCSDNCGAKSKDDRKMACKLTTLELRQRKETVIASLKSQVVEKKELNDGYAYKFSGSDKTLDELIEFIKTERECCDFFTFNLSVEGDKSEAWMELKGAEGVKEFITAELDL